MKTGTKTWKARVNLTQEQKRAKEAYEYAERQEDRFAGSVFCNPFTLRQYGEKTRAAYEACKRLGMGVEHGL